MESTVLIPIKHLARQHTIPYTTIAYWVKTGKVIGQNKCADPISFNEYLTQYRPHTGKGIITYNGQQWISSVEVARQLGIGPHNAVDGIHKNKPDTYHSREGVYIKVRDFQKLDKDDLHWADLNRPEGYLTLKQAAKKHDIHYPTLASWHKRHPVRRIKLNSRVYLNASDLEAVAKAYVPNTEQAKEVVELNGLRWVPLRILAAKIGADPRHVAVSAKLSNSCQKINGRWYLKESDMNALCNEMQRRELNNIPWKLIA